VIIRNKPPCSIAFENYQPPVTELFRLPPLGSGWNALPDFVALLQHIRRLVVASDENFRPFPAIFPRFAL